MPKADGEPKSKLFFVEREIGLGDQGYRIQIDGNGVAISGNTEAGRFYGLQTLRQIVAGKDVIPNGTITDFPALERRGIPVGFHWFRQSDELLNRLARWKLNYVWNTGSFLNEKFRYSWREPLTEPESKKLAEYIAGMRRHFVEPAICLAPRGETSKDATQYGDPKSVAAVMRRFREIHALGVSDFGITFGLPLRRFRPPNPVTVELDSAKRPRAIISSTIRGKITRSRGPWLSSGDWWDRFFWVRQDWDVQLENGALYRLYRERDCWKLDGAHG